MVKGIFAELNNLAKNNGIALAIVAAVAIGLAYMNWLSYQKTSQQIDRLEGEIYDCYQENRQILINVITENTKALEGVKNELEDLNHKQ